MSDRLSGYGERLVQAFALAKLPAAQARSRLAKELGITVQALGRVINGPSKSFSAENHLKAARFLKVDPWWLATGEGEPRPEKLSPQALELAEAYDRLAPKEREQFMLLLKVAGIVAPDPDVDPPGAPIGAPGQDDSKKPQLSKSRIE